MLCAQGATAAAKLVVHAMGFVIPSSLIRGTLTAVFWIAPMPMPTSVHETLEQALDWAITTLDKHGEPIDPDLLMNGVMAIERKRAALSPAAATTRR